MPSNSPAVALDELVDLVGDKVASNKDWALPYVGLEQMAEGSPDLLGTLPASVSVSVNGAFRSGDILFGKLRPNLRKSVLVRFNGYCSTDILVLRPKAGVVPEYAAKVFQFDDVFGAAVGTAEGTKMPRTSWDKLRRYRVRRFEPDQQRRIADILDAADEGIRRTEAVIAKLKLMKDGLLHDLLTRGLDAHGRLRDPITHPEQFKDSPLGRIPKEWAIGKLDDVAEIVMGLSPPGSTYNTQGRGTPLINGPVEYGDRYPTLVQWTTLPAKMCRAGDILFCVRGSTTGRINISNGDYCIGRGVAAIRGRTGVSHTPFLEYFLLRLAAAVLSEARGSGSTFPSVTGSRLSSYELQLPPILEQVRIAEMIESHERRLRSEETYADKLRLQKTGLMHDLLTGRVPVSATEVANRA